MPDGGRQRVLVVDDNDMSRELAQDILGDAGYDVGVASTVADALSALDRDKPAAVLLDWHLKGATGAEVLQAVRAESDPGRAAVLVVTADIRTELRDAALAAGADGIVTKPYRAAALLEAVSRVLQTTDGGGT